MTFSEEHTVRVVRLLKKDAERRKYVKEYMQEYRAKKKLETGKGQKQYGKPDDKKRIAKEYYFKNTVINYVKYLFEE